VFHFMGETSCFASECAFNRFSWSPSASLRAYAQTSLETV
jgi:hypothetical protein